MFLDPALSNCASLFDDDNLNILDINSDLIFVNSVHNDPTVWIVIVVLFLKKFKLGFFKIIKYCRAYLFFMTLLFRSATLMDSC